MIPRPTKGADASNGKCRGNTIEIILIRRKCTSDAVFLLLEKYLGRTDNFPENCQKNAYRKFVCYQGTKDQEI